MDSHYWTSVRIGYAFGAPKFNKLNMKLNKQKVRQAIKGSGGVFSTIAKKCNVHRSAITLFFQKEENQDLLKEVIEEKEVLLDLAENKLTELITEGEFNAIKYVLNCQGKHRGYTEKPEIVFNQQNLQTNIQLSMFDLIILAKKIKNEPTITVE